MRQTRILVLNLIDILLREYSIEESRFLRKPAVLVTCFLNSGFARELRRENKIDELLNGLDFKKIHKSLKVEDQEYRYTYIGKKGIKGYEINDEKLDETTE